MKVERVDRNKYMAEGETVERVQIKANFSSIRVKEGDAYLLCHEILDCLNNED